MSNSAPKVPVRQISEDPGDELRMLLLSDCHNQPLPEILDRIRQFPNPIDAILYGGDGLYRFNDGSTNYLDALADESNLGLFVVAGNDDPSGKESYIEGDKVYDVHDRPVVMGDFAIVGQEGTENRNDRVTPGVITYEKDQIERRLRRVLEKVENRNIVLLSHTPPDGILDRAIRFGDTERTFGKHEQDGYTSSNVGSKAVASVLDDYESIRVVVCGHVHKMGGRIEEIGAGQHAVNVASHDKATSDLKIGRVVLAEGGRVKRCTGELRRQAFQRNEINTLRSIPGIGRSTAKKLIDLGIENIEELSNASIEVLKEEIPHTSRSWETLLGRAEARQTGTPQFLKTPNFPAPPRVYLDIETDLNPKSLVWLIGLYNDQADEIEYFFAETPEQEKEMLGNFLSYLKQHSDASLFHYSTTRFDERILKTRLQANKLPIPEQIEESVDVGAELEKCVAMPTTSNTLTSVAGEFGYNFTYPSMNGRDVATTYLNCLENNQAVPERLFEYNRDDVLAVKQIVDWMERAAEESEDTNAGNEKTASNSVPSDSDYELLAREFEEMDNDDVLVVSEIEAEEVKEMVRYLSWRFGKENVELRLNEEGEQVQAYFFK
jgi:Icc-related predicted phosphoesterase/uncharacterized protein YprB with RNaseH-like and TPR domain